MRQAFRRLKPVLRGNGKKNYEPLNLAPTTPFEQAILYQYEELRRDYEDLKKRVDWLTLSIVGTALTFVLERLFS